MADVQLLLNDDHPLALELVSLRAAVARYQHEAHATSVKLQRHSLETSYALEHAQTLERENSRLQEEVAVLRASPDSTPHPGSFQVPELTLALRRLSDKLTLVEEALLTRTNEATVARSDLTKAQHETEAAHALAAEARAQEEEGKTRERELQKRARFAEEERKMADLVVHEYADLVRTLEGRSKSTSSSSSSVTSEEKMDGSSTPLIDSLAEGKSGLQRLLEEFNTVNERLETEIVRLHSETLHMASKIEITQKVAEHDRGELSKAIQELEMYKADDNTAAKMVSRYMKFSQASTDSLQKAMETLRTRHEATTATLSAEIEHLQKALVFEKHESQKLRHALDELSEDIAREAYGRRREISLRLAFLGREEGLAEGLRRWVRKATESFDRALSASESREDHAGMREMFNRIMADAQGLLEYLNGQLTLDENPPGSVARLLLAQDAISTLTHELQTETVRRLQTERRLAQVHDAVETLTCEDETNIQVPLGSPTANGHLSETNEIYHHEQVPASPEVTSPGPASLTKPAVNDIQSALALPNTSIPSPERSPDISSPTPNVVASPLDIDLPQDTPVATPIAITDATVVDDSPSVLHTRAIATASISLTAQLTESSSPCPPPQSDHAGTESASLSPGGPSQLPRSSVLLRSAPTGNENSHEVEPAVLGAPTYTSEDVPEVEVAGLRNIVSGETTVHSHIVSQDDGALLDGLEIVSSPTTSSAPKEMNSALFSAPTTNLKSNRTGLLVDLTRVKHRYDDFQRAFRDCYLALKDLKKDLLSQSYPSDMLFMLSKAVERLNDFNEDARVELEIRITDEERIISGYEALLSIPGAISEEVDEAAVELEIGAFIDGTDKAVYRTTQQFTRKLDDLEHDIASVKRTLHESSSSERPSQPSTPTRPSPGWSSWTAGFLSAQRPVSPAPTFGSVMTSPRLRHSSSFSHPRESSGESTGSSTDPFASLGLRIPMPSHILQVSPNLVSPGPPKVTPKPRASSAMYMLGFGARPQTFGLNTTPTKSSPVRKLDKRILS
ncbi:hypothetical protein A0H81_14230 [Grifola frondosa]|uniref:Uncharacterized protein n=1 Tax=Grifola frondosa TaxID=5627 RepID=A0A1C7LLT2_GRIFR|nr:hypothetical protein A0H81_14230 [Grifola frondosa]